MPELPTIIAFVSGSLWPAVLAGLGKLWEHWQKREERQVASEDARAARIERADQTVWERMQQQINAQDLRLDELELENKTLRGERDQYKAAWEEERQKNKDLERRLKLVEDELKQLRGGGSGPSRPQGLRPPR